LNLTNHQLNYGSHSARLHYPALDGMRGLAILLVVIYHNFTFSNYSYFGWLGVDLFFVLSGFLITSILLNTTGQPGALKNFFAKRALRILPLYTLSLIVFLFIVPSLTAHKELFTYYRQNQLWLWTFLQNWLYIFFPSPNGMGLLNHYWSLAVEEQFYLLWPFAFLVIKKPKGLLLFISLVLMIVFGVRLFIWINRIENLAYYNFYTFSRIDGICIGCMVALIQHTYGNVLSRFMPWVVLGFAGLNFLFDAINRIYHFTFPYLALVGYTTFAFLFGLLVNAGTMGNNRFIRNIFTLPPLPFLGKISFGLYIIHWPLYILLSPVLAAWIPLEPGIVSNSITSLLCALLAVGLSIASYYAFELYFLKLKRNFDPVPIKAGGAIE
jgi:peptidoglycan/LPS O-acetylase OafA/YrhL